MRLDFNSWFVGLVDGEGSFWIEVEERKGRKSPEIQMAFELQMSVKELPLLEFVQKHLKIGKIRISKNRSTAKFGVYSKEDLGKLITFFEKHPLRSSKRETFLLFKEAYQILSKRKKIRDEKGRFVFSLSDNDLKKLEEIRNKMNLTYSKRKSPAIRNGYHYHIPK
ncbi:MAG: LAGLIDADG family homing endonuclease [Candidatus Asgardarchaeia archaeon]